MNKNYTLLSTTVVPVTSQYADSVDSIELYQVTDEEVHQFLLDLDMYRYAPEYFSDDPQYRKKLEEAGSVRKAVCADLGLVEEPGYSVLPGGVYHRYDAMLVCGVVAVVKTTGLNI